MRIRPGTSDPAHIGTVGLVGQWRNGERVMLRIRNKKGQHYRCAGREKNLLPKSLLGAARTDHLQVGYA
jgi:hypothetical protein